jgi:hypothetical protein
MRAGNVPDILIVSTLLFLTSGSGSDELDANTMKKAITSKIKEVKMPKQEAKNDLKKVMIVYYLRYFLE